MYTESNSEYTTSVGSPFYNGYFDVIESEISQAIDFAEKIEKLFLDTPLKLIDSDHEFGSEFRDFAQGEMFIGTRTDGDVFEFYDTTISGLPLNQALTWEEFKGHVLRVFPILLPQI